jgi:dTMP kinase
MARARGLFVTLEGPEGAGKSTQARRLAAALRRRGRAVVLLREPGSTRLGQRLRRLLLHDRQPIAPMAEALLFFAARVQLLEERIRPALRRGAVVVCDRFHDSTVAYQGGGGGLGVDRLDRLGRQLIGDGMPHLTLLLDVPSAVGFRRLGRARDRMESRGAAFHGRVRRAFRALARRDPRRFVVIDATGSVEAVHRRILDAVTRRLG